MDIYTRIYDLVSAIPLFNSWPEMNTILKHAVANKPRYWQLPILSCRAVGGQEAQAIPAAAAIACLQISIILIDDMLDDDPRGDFRRVGAPAAANMAASFQAIGLEIVAQSDLLLPSQKLAMLRTLNQMIFTTAYGQYKDTENLVDEAAYWHLVETKSAPFFGTAFQVGAIAGLPMDEAAVDTIARIRQLGEMYGEMVQIHDDLNDAMAQPASPDWILGRSPLPVLFAKIVSHLQQAYFCHLCDNICEPEALQKAQTILIQCGAVSYCVNELILRHQKAVTLLHHTALAYKDVLNALLADMIEPALQMLDGLDNSRPVPPLNSIVIPPPIQPQTGAMAW